MQHLKIAIDAVRAQIESLQEALNILEGMSSGVSSYPGARESLRRGAQANSRGPRRMSEEARARIKAAQQKRWAEYREGKAQAERAPEPIPVAEVIQSLQTPLPEVSEERPKRMRVSKPS